MPPPPNRPRDERGAVTAEAAMALPALVAFTLAMVWLVGLGVTQVRAVDAAREVARATARSDSSARAVALGRQVAPAGSRITVTVDGDTVRAHVTSPLRGPGGLLRHLGGLEVEASAVAVQEPS